MTGPAADRSPLLARPGAVEGDRPDGGVALHYGDPVREQRALEEGRGVVDLSHLGVVTVAGADRLSWLHALTSQAVAGLAAGESREVLVLDPHGHVEHAAALVDDGERAWLVTEGAAAPRLVAYLDSMRFLLRVEVEDASAGWAVLGTTEPGAGRLADAAPGAVVWRDPWPGVADGGAAYGPVGSAHPGHGHRFVLAVVPRAEVGAVVARAEAAGAILAGTWAAEALRIAAWRPRLGREVDERTVPHELDWLRTAVHLHKGCYRGQETVARVVNLGRPPRRIVFLHLDGSEHVLPAPGAPVRWGGRVVGRVTSAARHRELGPVALAVVKRSVPADAVLTVAESPAVAATGEGASGEGVRADEATGGGAAEVAAAQEVIVPVEGVSDARLPERAEMPPVRALPRRPAR